MKWALSIVACACSPAKPPAGVTGCNAELSGNFRDSSWSVKNCPTIAAGVGATAGGTLLQWKLPTRSLALTLDLGHAPTAGAYNSGTTDFWSASGIQPIRSGACLYQAGNNVTPTGDFVLDLTAIDHTTAHGTLSLRMFVLPRAADDGRQTDCGPGTTEQLQLRF